MAFKKLEKAPYPPRLWALVGYPGSGKSTFATQMRTPILPIDADHRFDEVVDLIPGGEVYEFSDTPADSVSTDRIRAILAANMPGSGIQTIVVDSLTTIITPLVVQAMIDKDAGREKNLAAAFRAKALAMRQLQDAVTMWGCDTLWIYHLNDARDGRGRELTRATVSKTELARLVRSINMQLEIVQDDRSGKRGVKVVWARRGRAGMVLWDETGTWAGMPEQIEAAVYDGLTEAEQEEIEGQAPAAFPNAETAISWGLEQGAFQALQHARNAYDKLKRERKPKTAEEMAALWVADVEERLLFPVEEGAAGAGDEGAGDDETAGNGGQVEAQAAERPALPVPADPEPGDVATEPPPGPDEEESEVDAYFPRQPAAQGNGQAGRQGNGKTRQGNGKGAGNVPTSPAALLAAVQAEVPGYFSSVRGLFEALRVELGSSWGWPTAGDTAGWKQAQETASRFVDKNS